MPVDERYRRQVELPVRTLPHVAQERCFALKGGTEFNLFVRNLPRLPVDIDLTYLPDAGRARSLADAEAELRRTGERFKGALPVADVQTGVLREEGTVNKLFVREPGTLIKVEEPHFLSVRQEDERYAQLLGVVPSLALRPDRCSHAWSQAPTWTGLAGRRARSQPACRRAAHVRTGHSNRRTGSSPHPRAARRS